MYILLWQNQKEEAGMEIPKAIKEQEEKAAWQLPDLMIQNFIQRSEAKADERVQGISRMIRREQESQAVKAGAHNCTDGLFTQPINKQIV